MLPNVFICYSYLSYISYTLMPYHVESNPLARSHIFVPLHLLADGGEFLVFYSGEGGNAEVGSSHGDERQGMKDSGLRAEVGGRG